MRCDPHRLSWRDAGVYLTAESDRGELDRSVKVGGAGSEGHDQKAAYDQIWDCHVRNRRRDTSNLLDRRLHIGLSVGRPVRVP